MVISEYGERLHLDSVFCTFFNETTNCLVAHACVVACSSKPRSVADHHTWWHAMGWLNSYSLNVWDRRPNDIFMWVRINRVSPLDVVGG